MRLTFLTPEAAAVALVALVPLAAVVLAIRRADRVRGLLRLARSRRPAPAVPLAAVALAGVLLGLAASQPILERDVVQRVRSDAEVFVVIDVSRSMLARSDAEATTRLERASDAALELRDGLVDTRVGVASLTDRVLPHLFPSPDVESFRSTVVNALGIERPPPREALSINATTLEALIGLGTRRFYSRTAEHRLAIFLTDGESRPVHEISVASSLRRAAVETVFVHVWGGNERVFSQGVPEPEYRPDRTARERLDRLADATDGGVYSEGQLGRAIEKSRELLQEGPSAVESARRDREPLAPYLAAAAFLPLGLLLARRSR
jgi:hypothetical protein